MNTETKEYHPGLQKDWGRIVGQGYGQLTARRYIVSSSDWIINYWRQQMHLAYICFMESAREKEFAHSYQFFLASEMCKQLLGLPLKIPVKREYGNTYPPFDEDAQRRFQEYIDSKKTNYFAMLIYVYGELTNTFSSDPQWGGGDEFYDDQISHKFVMTLERRGVIQMSMALRISKDKLRSNHQYIVKSISPELMHVFEPDNYPKPPQKISMQMHRMTAISTLKTFPTVQRVVIYGALPKMLEIFKANGMQEPYTPQEFAAYMGQNPQNLKSLECSICSQKATRTLAHDRCVFFCDKNECASVFAEAAF